MYTIQFLSHLVENHQFLVYALIFLGIIIEGEFILLCAGVLLHLGALDISFTLPFIFAAGFCKTFFGYRLGSFLHEKWNHTKFFRYVEKRVLDVVPHFREKPFWSI